MYLNTETVQYKNGHNFSHFEVTTLNLLHPKKKSRWSWSQRMLDVLDRVKEEYVLILVEDFFLREKVQTEIIENLLDIMDADNMIGQIQLFGTRTNCDNEKMNDMNATIDLQQIGDGKAKVVFVPTIWRKDVLKKWMRKWETIWAFESYASKRAKWWHYKEKVFRLYSPAVFNYLWEKECYCVVNGK
ncbi:MAG: hypothetical protein Q3994_00370 [Prevotella sp.]|nr:hypothetical protein [Prevotella sp.]